MGTRRLRRARADPRRAGRRPRRPVRARLPALRVPDRHAAVPPRLRDGSDLRPPRGARAARERAPRRASRPPSMPCSRALAKEPDERFDVVRRARRRPRAPPSASPRAAASAGGSSSQRCGARGRGRRAIVILAVSGGSDAAARAAGTSTRIAPGSGAVAARTRIPGYPGAVAVSPGGVWIADFRDERALALSGATAAVSSASPPTASRATVAVVGASVYVAADGELNSGQRVALRRQPRASAPTASTSSHARSARATASCGRRAARSSSA